MHITRDPGAKAQDACLIKHFTPSPRHPHDVSRAFVVSFSSDFFSLLLFLCFLTINFFSGAVPKPNRTPQRGLWQYGVICTLYVLSICMKVLESTTNSRSSGYFWSGRWRCPGSKGRVKCSFVRTLELVNIFRQVHLCFAGASFLLHGDLSWPLLKHRSARITLTRLTLLDDPSRWTLSFPYFCSVLRAHGEVNGVSRFQFSCIPKNRLSRMRFWDTTQLYILWQWSHWYFRTTRLWLFAGLLLRQHVENSTSCPKCFLSQTCNVDKREDANN